MAIEFRCTQCNKLLRTADQSAGKKAKCPECGQILRVPGPDSGAPAVGPPPPPIDTGAAPPGRSAAAAAGQPAPPGELVPAKLDMGDLFRTTWELFKREPLMCILAPIVMALFVFLSVGLAWVAVVVGGLISGSLVVGIFLAVVVVLATIPFQVWVGIGLAQFFLNVARGRPAGFGDLFSGRPDQILPFFLAALLYNVMVHVGTLLLIVPGIILATMFSQFSYLIIDRGMGVFDSLKFSKVLTNGNKMTLFLTALVGWLGAAAFTVVTLGIGSLVVGPFVSLLIAVVYLRITSQPTGVDGS